MAQANFAYASPDIEPAGLSLAVSVYADRAHLREQMREDAVAAGLAALARLELRAARAGAQLVVSTLIAALEDGFGCLDQSAPQILVDPGRSGISGLATFPNA